MNKPDQTIEEILKPLRKYSISIAFEQELNIATQATSDLLIKARIDEIRYLLKLNDPENSLYIDMSSDELENRISQLKEGK